METAVSKVTSGASVHSLPESSSSKSKLLQNGSARSFSISTSSSMKTVNSLNHLHAMEPDEIFAKHTVHEVKSMLYRLRQVLLLLESSSITLETHDKTYRADVDAKQEELRLMVG